MARPLETEIEATTPESRLRTLQNCAADFSTHLKKTPGTILTPELRLGVAICARDSLFGCKGKGGSREVCHRGGLYDFVAGVKHEPAFPTPQGASTGSVESCLVNIVHAIICHQSKIDATWHADSIAALQSCGVLSSYAKVHLLGSHYSKDEMELAGHSALCEIIILASTSHGIRSTFLALGLDVPSLPTWEELKGAPGPTNIRFSSLLQNSVRRDESVGAAPFYLTKDLKRNCPEYSKLDEEVWKELDLRLFKRGPFVCLAFSPQDSNFFGRFIDCYYLTKTEMIFCWNELDSSRRCYSVTRLDIETIADAMSFEHSSRF